MEDLLVVPARSTEGSDIADLILIGKHKKKKDKNGEKLAK